MNLRLFVVGLVFCAPAPLAGCFSQRSFPVRSERLVSVTAAPQSDSPPRDVRSWLSAAHAQLAELLPPEDRATPLLTDNLVDSTGRPTDVFAHFDRDPARLHTLLGNLTGLTHSAQASGADTSDEWDVPPWPGFDDVWIPVADGFENFARFGRAERDGQTTNANCIFILPGIFGDLAVWRTRDVAMALRAAGYHVIAIEPRGMGRTNQRYPEVYHTFGVLESEDLITAALWAQRLPYVDQTGLIGFCWSANVALTTAWSANRDAGHIGLSPHLREHVQPTHASPVFEAGYLAFSPVLRFEEIAAQCRGPISIFDNPVINSLQGTVRNRMEQKQHPEISGDLGLCIDFEFQRTKGYYPGMVADAYGYLRMLPYRELPDGDKLECVRNPVLIVQGANDPLTSAQNVADLIAQTDNPNVAAIVLPGGGHVGFAPYARDYFYSLLIGFFDPENGAAANLSPHHVQPTLVPIHHE